MLAEQIATICISCVAIFRIDTTVNAQLPFANELGRQIAIADDAHKRYTVPLLTSSVGYHFFIYIKTISVECTQILKLFLCSTNYYHPLLLFCPLTRKWQD